MEIDKAFPAGWGLEFPFNIPNACSNREQRRVQRLNGTEVKEWILYADDVVLFTKNVQEAETMLGILHITCKRYGLNMPFKKTKFQVFNDETLAGKPTLLKVAGHVIENAREFVYLGHVFSNQGY